MDSMSEGARDILIAARSVIVDPNRWCPDALVLDGPRYCAHGALNAVSQRTTWTGWVQDMSRVRVEAGSALRAVCHRLFGTSVISVNNTMGHDAILLAFDVAIGDLPDHAIKERACAAGCREVG